MHGAVMHDQVKSVSAVRPKRESGHARAKKRRGGHNVIWKRITASWDAELKAFGANPAMVAPLSRWALYGHLTVKQAMAGRRYAYIVRRFERYCLPAASRSARSANLEPLRAEDQEIEKRINLGTLDQYESDAAEAKRHYRKAMRVLDKFADNLTGRNMAKDTLDTLCLSEEEPPAQYRRATALVLEELAKAFGIEERR